MCALPVNTKKNYMKSIILSLNYCFIITKEKYEIIRLNSSSFLQK